MSNARPLDVRQAQAAAVILPFVVKAASAVTKGKPVKLDTSTGTVLDMAAVGDNVIGIALDTGAAGDTVRVALWGPGVVPALVGTAGATMGAPAKYASDGLVDGTVGGGTTKLFVCGQFLETGVAGDFVGLNLSAAGFSVGS